MKAIIEFNLPEEQEEYDTFHRAQEFHSALWEIDQKLRSCLKHGHEYKTVDDALEDLRTFLRDNLNGGLG